MALRDGKRKVEGFLIVCALFVLIPALTLVFLGKSRQGPPANAIPLNEITARQLKAALGIDVDVAERIVAYRTAAGGFDSTDQILDIPLFSREDAARLTGIAAKTRANLATMTPGQLAQELNLLPLDARRLAAYRDALIASNGVNTPAQAQDAAALPLILRTAAPKSLPPTWITHATLLDAAAVRPLLKRFPARTPGSVLRHFAAVAAGLALVFFFVPPWMRARGIGGDPILVPVALLLAGLGVVLMFSVKDPYRDHPVYEHHFLGVLFSIVVMALAARIVPAARLRIKHYQYIWVFAAVALVVALFLFGNGPEGVKLNLFHFQPVEIIKLMLVFFLAGYLSERAGLIADVSHVHAGAAGNRKSPLGRFSLPRREDFGPMTVMFAISLALFYVLKDLGPGLLLFATFVSMLYLTTGRFSFLVIGAILILVGGTVGYFHHVGVFATRVDMWLNPFANTHPTGMQLGQSLWAMASGGVEGSGLGLGMPGLIPRSGSDLAFASWTEETGMIGASLILTLYALLVWRGMRIALRAANDFDRSLAFGLTALLGLQTIMIIGGVTGVVPLTGIALPFLSYGNSALVANFVIIGLLRGISGPLPGGVGRLQPRPEVIAAARRFTVAFAVLLLGGIGLAKLGKLLVLNADAIASRRVVTPDADGIARPHLNPRLFVIEREIERGSIYDRNNKVLATSRAKEMKPYLKDDNRIARLVDSRGRYYPYGRAFAQLVGYLSPAIGGPSGLEHSYNLGLRGYDQATDLLADYRNRNLPGYHPRRGRDIHTTLDVRLQEIAQQQLLQTTTRLRDLKTGRPKDKGSLVVMDWQTGDVLAAATIPTFDPNTLTPQDFHRFITDKSEADEHRLMNRALYGYYPPGSTLKTATAACALDNLNNALKFEVTCNREYPEIQWQVGGVTHTRRHIHDDQGDPAFGTLTLAPAFRVSSNIYFANLAAAIGSNTFRSTLTDKMGFSRVPKQQVFDDELPYIGFGQGPMLATPLEMCRLVAAVPNGGDLIQKKLVSQITDPAGMDKPVKFPPNVLQAMTPRTADTMRTLMRSVVTGGTASGVFTDPTILVAGKTGTAQNPEADGQPHSWFIGFAPYVEGGTPTAPPHYAFACVVENAGYGKRVAAVICRNFLHASLR